MNLSDIKTDLDVIRYVGSQLIDQDARSNNEDMRCTYRGDTENRKCAVGHLIADELYTPSIEGEGAKHDVVLSLVQRSLPNWEINEDLLEDMQIIHDEDAINTWFMSFRGLEKRINDNGKYISNWVKLGGSNVKG